MLLPMLVPESSPPPAHALGHIVWGTDSSTTWKYDAPCFQTGLPTANEKTGWRLDWIERTEHPATHIQYTQAPVHIEWKNAQHYGFGLATLPASANIAQDTLQAYSTVLALIKKQGFPHILRTWHYLPNIHAKEQGLERYRQFNIGRQNAYQAAGLHAQSPFPAASVLGCTERAFWKMAFIAARSPGIAIENPKQTSAFHYPNAYGRTPPLFSRALNHRTAQHELLLISGTASISGHQSMHIGNVYAQAGLMLDNIQTLLQSANIHSRRKNLPPFQIERLVPLCYVRHKEDAAGVQDYLQKRLKTQHCPVVIADVCREDLLVEIEACGTLNFSLPL